MKKTLYTLLLMMFVLSFSNSSFAQIKLQEGFETTDTLGGVPQGWSVWNNLTVPAAGNWTVMDSGRTMRHYGLTNGISKSHSGNKAETITFYAGTDTNGTYMIADSWLVSKRVNISAGDSLRFFVTGGSPSWYDSIQVWVSFIDSLPENFILFPQYKLGSIAFPVGSTFGEFVRKAYSLNIVAGQTAWIGFRYYMDCTVQGYCVMLDDILIGSPNVGVNPNGTNLPEKFSLEQNYPNPFNPNTNIKFNLPQATNVQLIIYNSMGQEVKALVNEFKYAGSYSVDFNASSLSSGVYFYKLITNEFVETKKMTLVK